MGSTKWKVFYLTTHSSYFIFDVRPPSGIDPVTTHNIIRHFTTELHLTPHILMSHVNHCYTGPDGAVAMSLLMGW